MKLRARIILTWLLWLVVLLLTSGLARNAQAGAGAAKSWTGNVKAVSATDKTLAVKGFWGTRAFHLGDNCQFTIGGKSGETSASLRPGQKVHVQYENADGVLIARRVVQENRICQGTIQSIDPNSRRLAVKRGGNVTEFELAVGCKVVLKDEKAGTLQDLKPGHRVEVVYEEPGGTWVAQQVGQRSASYVGTLTAIDASARTLKAEHGLSERKFSMGDRCSIIVDGKMDSTLRDLRLGEKVVVNYDDIDGVLVANRLALAEPSKPSELSAGPKR